MENKKNQKRTIRETKCTCKACGNVWFYGKEDTMKNCGTELENCGSGMQNAGKSMMCCSGCAPAAFIPNQTAKTG